MVLNAGEILESVFRGKRHCPSHTNSGLKEEEGRISIKAKGDHIQVQCSDDILGVFCHLILSMLPSNDVKLDTCNSYSRPYQLFKVKDGRI